MKKGYLILNAVIVAVIVIGALVYYNNSKSKVVTEKHISFVERNKVDNENKSNVIAEEGNRNENYISENTNDIKEKVKNEANDINNSIKEEIDNINDKIEEEMNNINNNINNVIDENINEPIDNMNVPNNNYQGNVNGSFLAEVESLIFQKVNVERQKAGLQVYSYNNSMEKYARIKSEDMGVRGYFDHSNPEGELITETMSRDGVGYNAWGENIAYITGGNDANTLANQFMNNWMNSSGHRANILSTNFTDIGVGVYSIGNSVYATQEFYR